MTTSGNVASRTSEAAREQAYELLRVMVDCSLDPLVAVDADLTLIMYNEAARAQAQRVLGVDLMLEARLPELLAAHPAERDEAVALWRRAIAGERFTLVRAVGQPAVYFEIHYGPLPPVAGLRGAFCTAREVSERIRVEQARERLNQELEARVAERTAALEQANRRLRKQDEFLRAALRSSHTGTFRWEIDTDRVDWDEGLLRLFGLEAHQAPRTVAGFLALVHPDDVPVVQARLARGMSAGGDIELLFRIRHRDGGERWVHDHSQYYPAAEGEPAHVTGACTDVTAFKALEQELELREQRLREVLDTMSTLVWMRSDERGLEYVNAQWTAYTGLDLSATAERGWASVVHPDDLPEVQRRLAEARGRGEAALIEYRLRGVDGNYRWFVARSVPVRDAAGRVMKWVGSATDVEEQFRIRAQLSAIVSHITEGLVIFDASGRRISRNPAASRMLGVSPEHDLPEDWQRQGTEFKVRDLDGKLLTPDEWPVARALRGETFTNVELQLHRLDTGEPWIASFGGAPVYDRAGLLQFVVLTMRDVTARHQAARALRDAVEARDRFLSIASHELRTPLTSLVLQLQLGRRRLDQAQVPPALREVVEPVLERAGRQAARLGKLINDLLEVSRIQAGRLEFQLAPVDLCRLAGEVAELSRGTLAEAGCRLELDLAEAAGEWDAHRLEQVITNLLSNCARYAPGATVRVRVWSEADAALLEVADDGPGIAPEDQQHVFERFGRGRDGRHGGLGLGLYLVKELVTGHGGRVELESAPGRGTRVLVRLPRHAE